MKFLEMDIKMVWIPSMGKTPTYSLLLMYIPAEF